MSSRSRLLVLCVMLSACSSKDSTSTAPSIVVTSVQLSVSSSSLRVGGTMQATVTIADQHGNPVAGENVSWSSSDGTVATVNSTGLITGVGAGSAIITAISAGKSGSVTVQVTAVPIARIVVSPTTIAVQPWQTGSLTAVAYDSAGNQLNGRSISWLSSDTLRAPVSSQGVVTGNLLGTFTVTASSEGHSGSATVKIAPATSVMVGPNINMDPTLSVSQETSVAINPLNPLNVVASTNWAHFFSFDGGRSWKRTDVAAIGQANGDPNVAFDTHGNVFRQGRASANPSYIVVHSSHDGGRTLSQGVNAYQPQPGTGAPDQGMLTIDTVTTSPYFGTMYVTTSDYQAGSTAPSYAAVGLNPLIVFSSRDGGNTWSVPVDISDNPLAEQEYGSGITTGPKGEVYDAWVNGTSNTIRFARSLDGGHSWSKNIIVRQLPAFLNINTLTADIHGFICIDVDRSSGPNRGAIYLTSVDINGPSGGASDAWVMKSTDQGSTWSSPVLLSDASRGPNKYDFQPRISVAPNGRVDAAWYGITSWAGAGTPSFDVFYSYSTNGGVSFSPSVRVTSASSPKVPSIFGEYMGLASDSTRALVSWSDMRLGSPNAPEAFFAVIWNVPASSSQSVRRAKITVRPNPR